MIFVSPTFSATLNYCQECISRPLKFITTIIVDYCNHRILGSTARWLLPSRIRQSFFACESSMVLYAKSPEIYRMVPSPATSEWNLAEYINILKRSTSITEWKNRKSCHTGKWGLLEHKGRISVFKDKAIPRVRRCPEDANHFLPAPRCLLKDAAQIGSPRRGRPL